MDDVARLRAADRADLFVVTGTGRGLTSEMIEKDFWVCWTLNRLFTLPEPPAKLLFKGGTSLSKVFGIIERFSEDVNLLFDRAGLGFAGEDDPLNATAEKKRKRGVKSLKRECRSVVAERLLPQLVAVFGDALGEPPSTTWGLELANDDKDGQTLLFRYPSGLHSRPAEEPAYIQPFVRLEFGAFSDHSAAVEAPVSPYAAVDFPSVFKEPGCKVLGSPPSGPLGEGNSAAHVVPCRGGQEAPASAVAALLRRGAVVQTRVGKGRCQEHRPVAEGRPAQGSILPGGLGGYKDAKPGTLRIVPPDARLTELEQTTEKCRR